MIDLRVEGLLETRRKLELLGERSSPAISWSINKSLINARSVSNKQIRQQIVAKQADINRELVKKNAKPSTLIGTIETPKKGRPLSKYPFTELKRGGVSVRVKPTGGRIRLPAAVVVPASVMRYSKIKFIAGKTPDDRFNWLYGPSISQVWTGVRDDDLVAFAEYFNRQLLFRIDYELGRL